MTATSDLANSNVVPLGRGQFFAVDRRTWAKACDLGMNAAIAYLVLTRGTGPDMRTTSWSAKAMEGRTAVPWRQCKVAVQALVTAELVRQDKAGQHPRYTVLPAHDVPGCVPGGQREALDSAETALVEKIGVGRLWVAKSAAFHSEWQRIGTRPHEVAVKLVSKGVLLDHGRQFFSVVPPPVDDKPDWIWLPNAITDGAAGEEIPVEMIRQSANRAALRLFVDLYHAQSLDDFGGVHWREVRRSYARHRIGERGPFVVWGFKASDQFLGWGGAAFIGPHLTGTLTDRPKADGGFDRVDVGWEVLWSAFRMLEAIGLIEMVGHVINADTAEGTVLHPYGMRNGEPGEQAIALAAHDAGLAMLNEAKRADAVARGLWLLPIRSHMADVQIVGLVRLRYRARTRATAAWVSDSAEWVGWVERYRAAASVAIGTDVDINGISMTHQR